MLQLLETAIKSININPSVLEAAYQLYLQAPEEDSPVINLKELSQKTKISLLECRNTIVAANKIGKFPNCSLDY